MTAHRGHARGVTAGWYTYPIFAAALGSTRALERMGRILPWLTLPAGGFLTLFGAGMIASLAIHLSL